MKKIFLILYIFFSFSVFASEDLVGKKLLCSKLLWGFEFISSNEVKVIETNINKQSKIKNYFYEIDLELPYVNLYLIENNIRNPAYSIHLNTFRVDIWTMTSGGITTREMIPTGFCKIKDLDDIFNHIKNLK